VIDNTDWRSTNSQPVWAFIRDAPWHVSEIKTMAIHHYQERLCLASTRSFICRCTSPYIMHVFTRSRIRLQAYRSISTRWPVFIKKIPVHMSAQMLLKCWTKIYSGRVTCWSKDPCTLRADPCIVRTVLMTTSQLTVVTFYYKCAVIDSKK